jgi:hypothetical protein
MGIGGFFFPVGRRLISPIASRFVPSFHRQSFIAAVLHAQPINSACASNANPALWNQQAA